MSLAYLILLRHGRPTDRFKLGEGKHTAGRDDGGEIVILDPSVSREHARITISAGGVSLRDLNSSNGTKVNGVPRKTATLQDGDMLTLGAVELRFSFAPPIAPPVGLAIDMKTSARLQQTRRQALRLPDQKTERHLAAFYHLCAWVTEGVEEAEGLPQWLELLCESLRAHTVHFYTPKGTLAHVHTPEPPKPRVKFAPYLFDKFCALTESTAFAPHELDRFQQRLGHFHYLVAPMRIGPPTKQSTTRSCPIVAILRPAEWEPFSPEDRVLLQSACQLWLKAIQRAQTMSVLQSENTTLRAQASQKTGDGMIGSSAALKKLRTQLARTAKTKATVLITGETGSGKEVVATSIHHQSPRATQPFIKLNCGAIPSGLIESELFGHVKGAFTDARSDHKGKFTLASGGTLFLDEIGELPLTAQTKLLRVLEEGVIEPVGSERPHKVDVRIIAATNRDLTTEVTAQRFRQDLFYRLNVITVSAPPLREHRDDISELANHFLNSFCQENGLANLSLKATAIKALQQHPWPGNVRELRNVVQRLALEAEGTTITSKDVKTCLN